jgi:ribonucleoside-diphosphate reductase alpha chain
MRIRQEMAAGPRNPARLTHPLSPPHCAQHAWVVALTRMISAVFRRGGEVAFVAEELKQIFDPRGGQWINGRYVGSLVAAIGDVIERHMTEIGFLAPVEPLVAKAVVQASAGASAARFGPLCPKPSAASPASCAKPGA